MYQENEKSRALCENTTWVVMRLLSGGQPPSVNSKNANLLVSDILKCHFQIFRSDLPPLSLLCFYHSGLGGILIPQSLQSLQGLCLVPAV